MTFKEEYNSLVETFREAGHGEPEADARVLIEYVMENDQREVNEDSTIDPQDVLRLKHASKRIIAGEPVDYIVGKRWFMGFPFIVSPAVLIPRQDTEHLCEEAIKEAYANEYKTILDLCTGSGCLALSIKQFLDDMGHEVELHATDISFEALIVAERNRTTFQQNIILYKSDLFEEIDDSFDLIVSNPPYIPADQYENLDKKVKDYEPKLALYGGEDGLDFYRKIIVQAKDHLNPGGALFMEINFDQGESVPALLREAGYKDIEVLKDYSDHDRVVKAYI